MKKLYFILAAALMISLDASAQKAVRGDIQGLAPQPSYMPSFDVDGVDKAPLNVILMIGDGNGLSHISSAMFTNGGSLTLTNLKTIGIVRTQSADDYVTDSAASGTAYATGQKTYNSSIGMGLDHKPLKNIPELCAEHGIVSGVVSTDNLDGATPAAFFAHQNTRYMVDEIWADLPSSVLSFVAAGSKESLEKKSESTQKAIGEAFTVVDRLPESMDADRIAYFPPASEVGSKQYGRGEFLAESTEYAIEYLSSKTKPGKGFFLMVEGARIDKSAHGNDYATTVKEVLDFDNAITAAVKFAEKNGNTLVVISADHETGALTLFYGDPAKGSTSGVFTSVNHTPSPVPLFAYGPSSHEFMGVQENSDVAGKIIRLLIGE